MCGYRYIYIEEICIDQKCWLVWKMLATFATMGRKLTQRRSFKAPGVDNGKRSTSPGHKQASKRLRSMIELEPRTHTVIS